MSDILWQGLVISLTGMSLTFLALGLLVLVIILLDRFTRPREQASISAAKAPEQGLDAEVGVTNTVDEEIVAAIAVALARLGPSKGYPPDLGATLEAGPGAWWVMGRSQMQSVNTSRTGRWRC